MSERLMLRVLRTRVPALPADRPDCHGMRERLRRLAGSPRAASDAGLSSEAADLADLVIVVAGAGGARARHGRVEVLAHLVGGWRGGVHLATEPLKDWDWLHDLLVRTSTDKASRDDSQRRPG